MKNKSDISRLKLMQLFVLNFFLLTILFSVAITIEYGTDFLVEFSLELENEDGYEVEYEKDFENDGEKEKITHYQNYYIPNYGITSIYSLKEDTLDFFEKIKSPPPEFI